MAWQIRHNFMQEVNNLLRDLQLPWRCVESVEPDGDCFFHAVFVQLKKPKIASSTHPRALGCRSSLELRECVIDWSRRQSGLKDIEGFKLIPDWDKYLDNMRKTGTWADQHIICLTAMFLGKNIILATDTCTKERPWHPIELPDESIYTHPPVTLGYLGERHFEPIVRNVMDADECLGCGWHQGSSLRGHITRTKRLCRVFYNSTMMNEIYRGKGPKTQAHTVQEQDQVRHPYLQFKVAKINDIIS